MSHNVVTIVTLLSNFSSNTLRHFSRRNMRFVAIVSLLMTSLTVSAAAADTRDLLRDPRFEHGFTLLAPRAGQGQAGQLRFAGHSGPPAWEVAQWNSRWPFANAIFETNPTLCMSNVARWLVLDPAGTRSPTLTLGVDSRPEYGERPRRNPAEPWVHLLVQQAIVGAPSLAQTASLRLRFDARLREAETFRPDGYSPGLHAAQFQVVLTLNNTRRAAPGFGDFLWFVVPLYDDRYEVPPEYVAQDFAEARGKLIFNPGATALGLKATRVGEWQSADCELRPWLERALETARAKGYLRDSRDPADYSVAHINLGWEVPGLNRVAMDVRGLSLVATLANGG
jgi:hypothetical protein